MNERWLAGIRVRDPQRYQVLMKRVRQKGRRRAKAWWARLRQRPEAYKAYVQNTGLKQQYNLSLLSFNSMLAVQQGCCAICRNPLLHPQVDHDHVTGKVRGLVCAPCNRLIAGIEGVLRRGCPEAVSRALTFLRIHGVQ